MEVKKIVFVCGSKGGGGAERIAVNLAASFAEKQFKVFYFYWDEKPGNEYSLHDEVIQKKSASRSMWARVANLRSLIKTENIDAMVTFTDIPNIIGWLSCINIRKKVTRIPSVHNNLKSRDDQQKQSVKMKFLRKLHKLSLISSEKLVVVSNGGKEALVDYYDVPAEKIDVILNPVLDSVSPFLQKTAPRNKEVRLVAAGRLTKQKNYKQLIFSMRYLKEQGMNNVTLDIYGDGELRQEIEALIGELGLSSMVTLKGFDENFKEKLSQYDVFVMSSRWEGLPTVLIEALNAGLFVVSTDCPSGPAEILAHGRYGSLVPIDDVKGMAEAIQRITHNKQVHDTGLEGHLQQFTSTYAVNRYTALIIN